jgi:predicted ATPase
VCFAVQVKYWSVVGIGDVDCFGTFAGLLRYTAARHIAREGKAVYYLRALFCNHAFSRYVSGFALVAIELSDKRRRVGYSAPCLFTFMIYNGS